MKKEFKCEVCEDHGAVCEEHPDMPFKHPGCTCCAGIPCEFCPDDYEDKPTVWVN